MNEIEKMRIDLLKSVTWKELDDGVIALDIDGTTDHLRSKGYSKQSDNTVEVVRCKDCGYVEKTDLGLHCCYFEGDVSYEDYCSFAKQK